MCCIQKLLVIAISCCLGGTALAQEKKSDRSEAVELVREIDRLMDDGQWPEVAARMTDKAWDSWCERLVVECLSIANIDANMGFGLPGMDQAKQKIEEALEKHELDEIEIEQPSIEIRMNDLGDEEDVDIEGVKKENDAEQTKKILAALDANGKENRFTIIEDLWQARAGSPFSVSVFAGKVEKEESSNETVNLTISPKVVTGGSEEAGVMIQIQVPPVVIDVREIDGKWKYVGMNEKKTAEAMKKFKPKRGGGREDFEDF